MIKPQTFFASCTVLIFLLAQVAGAQRTSAEASPSPQVQSPVQAQTASSPSQLQMEQIPMMQNMDKMAKSVKEMADMCKMMMNKEMAMTRYAMPAGIAFGIVLFLDLLLLVLLEIQWIIHWSRKLKSQRTQ